MASEINVRQVKMINQGSQWLIVVTARVLGVPSVKMATVSDIAQVGTVVRKMLTAEEWKADKFAGKLVAKSA